ncbi:hypothetical protein [Erythrobacter sp.]|uniref:hypothetical protein n=1 Tax=Erythrobacter sp. TaxID=1042 RepID=UPI001425C470|nr:hypothetical protein [Erythrobacter sp.]QIQ86798.1 MAG: hypothetical protein G9473_08935 [Erythrobacter sp.]
MRASGPRLAHLLLNVDATMDGDMVVDADALDLGTASTITNNGLILATGAGREAIDMDTAERVTLVNNGTIATINDGNALGSADAVRLGADATVLNKGLITTQNGDSWGIVAGPARS